MAVSLRKPTLYVIVDRDGSLIGGTNEMKVARGFIVEQGMENRYEVRLRTEWERK